MHVQAVREQQAGAGFQVVLQHFVVQLLLHHVRGQYGDQVGILHCLGRRLYQETVSLGLGFGGAARTQAYSHIETGFTQVQRMCAALAAVADGGDLGLREGIGGVGHGVQFR